MAADHDTDELADKIKAVADAVIANSPAPGSLGIGEFVFGVSADDYVDSFSLVKISFSATEIISPIVYRAENSVSLEGIKDKLALTLKSVDVRSLPEKTIEARLKGSGDNGFNLTLSGLGYFSSGLGLDRTDILQVDGGFMDVNQGSNIIDLTTKVKFPSSSKIKAKVAFYANELYTLGANYTTSNFTAQSLIFGNSRERSFKFLSKASLSLKASSILTSALFDTIQAKVGFSVPVSEALKLNRVHINGATEEKTLLVDIGATAEKILIDFNVNVGYAALNIGVNGVT